MEAALREARQGASQGAVPVGAVIVRDGIVLACAHNQTVARRDPTAHAEVLAIREALGALGTDRLLDASLYVTLEPCAMCAGASVLAKVGRLVYATHDEKGGMCGSVGDLARHPRLNHRIEVVSGVLAEQGAALLTAFFHERRGSPAS
jgi:tRNA(adenine34) deaminase